jgi:3-oxoacyl-[acyl-carrier protein] reductase
MFDIRIANMDLSLVGRRALVCGSSQGIGLAAAVSLAELGADVTLLARDPQRLNAALAQLPKAARQFHQILIADFTRSDEVAARISGWVSDTGGAEILVNNTGGPAPGPAITATAEQFTAAFSAHLLMNQLLVQAMVPRMKAQNFGRIINVISTSVKQPIHGLGVSNTVRGAVANWAKTLAGELAPFGITVNNVLPGATRTARLDQILVDSAARSGGTVVDAEKKMLAPIPAGRFAEPGEIGAAIAFLASPAAGYITGINLPVDGGRTQCL